MKTIEISEKTRIKVDYKKYNLPKEVNIFFDKGCYYYELFLNDEEFLYCTLECPKELNVSLKTVCRTICCGIKLGLKKGEKIVKHPKNRYPFKLKIK